MVKHNNVVPNRHFHKDWQVGSFARVRPLLPGVELRGAGMAVA